MLPRSALSTLTLSIVLLTPALGFAQKEEGGPPSAPSILEYGLKGFWTGAELGLATGFLATGKHYDSGEWRKLVLGAGIGAVIGIGAGISLAVVDAGSSSHPMTGWLMLRDAGYGSLLGALTGAAIGALFWVDHGRPKNVLTGGSIGILVGSGAGLAFGVWEGSNVRRPSEPPPPPPPNGPPHAKHEDERGVRFMLTAIPAGDRMPVVMPMLLGKF